MRSLFRLTSLLTARQPQFLLSAVCLRGCVRSAPLRLCASVPTPIEASDPDHDWDMDGGDPAGARALRAAAVPACFMVPRVWGYPHPASADPEALIASCKVTHTRGSGPGGQHRNKVNTAVILEHEPTSITARATESRSQLENQKAALRRLRLRLALQLRCEEPGEPSALWRSRSKGGKLSVSEEHPDFPTLLAEALDHTWAGAGDVKAAAVQLGVSTSQLAKFLSKEPPALSWVNDVRRAKGLAPLRVS